MVALGSALLQRPGERPSGFSTWPAKRCPVHLARNVNQGAEHVQLLASSVSRYLDETARPGPHQRNGYLAAAPEKSIGDRESDEHVAREAQHQELIEATFDRAEAYARFGDFELAVERLDRAATLSGDLPPTYRVKRARGIRPRYARDSRLVDDGTGIRVLREEDSQPIPEERYAFELAGTPEAGLAARPRSSPATALLPRPRP